MSVRLISSFTTVAFTALASIALAQAPDKPAAPAKPAAPPAAASKPAAPPAAAPMAAPKPGPELDALKAWSGNWSCQLELMMPGAPAAMKGKSTISTKWEMGNMWMTYVYKIARTKEFPGGEGKGVIGYDSAKKEYMFVGVDSMGGYIDLTAPAVSATEVKWTGNGNSMGKIVPFEYTWTMKDKQADLTLSSGGQPLQHDVCKK